MDKYESRIIPNEVNQALTLEPLYPQEHPQLLDEAKILFQISQNPNKEAILDFLQCGEHAVYC